MFPCTCSGPCSFVSELSRKRIMLVWQEDQELEVILSYRVSSWLPGLQKTCLINKRWVRMAEWIKVLAAKSQWDPRSGRREPAPTTCSLTFTQVAYGIRKPTHTHTLLINKCHDNNKTKKKPLSLPKSLADRHSKLTLTLCSGLSRY